MTGSPVVTHIYGIPDRQPPVDLDVITHGGYNADFRESWFVVFNPSMKSTSDDEEAENADPAALLAIEIGPRKEEGYWTYRPKLVRDIDD